jgi:predicted nucleic acid-binding protein
VAVAVFDADVLIAYLARGDAHHDGTVERVRRALDPGTNYTEVLIGPLRSGGPDAAKTVDAMFARFGIETIWIDMPLARRAAAVRVRTRLRLPDAFAVATAIQAEKRGHEDVRLESFDEQVLKAYADLHPS